MNALKKNKTVLYAIVIFIVAIIAYNYLLKSSQEAITAGLTAQGVGNDVLTLNQSLQAVTLDQSLFMSPEYRSLTDWTPTLSPAVSGRTNPFAPIGQ